MTFRPATRRMIPALALAAIAALALAGCSGTSEPAQESTSAAAPVLTVDEAARALLPSDIQNSGVITVGSPYSLKPSIFTDDEGNPAGISVDMGDALGEILGVDIEWQEAADPVTALQAGTIDMSMGYLSDSPAREKALTMVPQFLNMTTLLVPVGSKVTDIASMCGMTLAVVAGSQQQATATAINTEDCAYDPIVITEFSGAKDALTQVQSGRANAFAAPRMILEGVVASASDTFAVTDANYDDYPFGMGFAKDSTGLADAIAAALLVLVESGTYQDILDEWDAGDIALTADQVGVNIGSSDAFAVND